MQNDTSQHRTGFIFRRKVPVAQMMAWQKGPLSSPLLTLNRTLKQDAVKFFKVIQHVMGGRKRDRPTGIPLHNGSTTSLLSCTSLSLLEEERWSIGEGLAHGELHLEERPAWKTALFAEIETAADAAFNPSTFGESLDATLRLQERNYPNEKIPVILPFHADGILAPGGMKCEGIFRVPGDSDLVSRLKLRIDRGYYTLENVDDPHMLASLLKLWLRELCDPSSPRSSTTTASMQDLIHLLVSLSREGFSETQDDGNKYGTRIVTQPAEVQSPVYDSSVYECTTFVYNLLSAMGPMKTTYRPLHPNLVSPNLAIGDEADIGLHQDLLGLHSQKWTLSMPLAPYVVESLFWLSPDLDRRPGETYIILSGTTDEYVDGHVDTAHKKNPFSLGEDRFVTASSVFRLSKPSLFWVR
ncbi:hypothetical protein EDC04DRAFT_2910443 [Pisolithus marmoratus]|nr:hypothetical protein EDC04DRAFT_2910443 [Pisolithus marmoratus]